LFAHGAAIDIFSAAIGDMEGFYPEGLFRLFIVRAPSTVSLAYNMVKVNARRIIALCLWWLGSAVNLETGPGV
jgi:hypothetical protein